MNVFSVLALSNQFSVQFPAENSLVIQLKCNVRGVGKSVPEIQVRNRHGFFTFTSTCTFKSL